MKKIIRFWSVLIVDTLGILLMVAALLTGWLPGPGGIPLFLLGLSLLAINHDWAKRYIVLVKKYAGRIGELIFIKDWRVELAYDLLSPLLAMTGALILIKREAVWMLPVGTFMLAFGLVIFLGNRQRWPKIKKLLKR